MSGTLGNQNPPAPDPDLEVWKEINLSAHHWETLVFANSKNFFTVVSLAIGAAGAVIAWSSVSRSAQKWVITLFLTTGILVSGYAVRAIKSSQKYLTGFYDRRDQIETRRPDLKLKDYVPGSGYTIGALKSCFYVAIGLSVCLILLTVLEPPSRPLLEGAQLAGADLSAVSGLTQMDLKGACGDTSTRLPAGLVVPQCCPAPSVEQKPATQPPATKSSPQPTRP